MSTAQYIIKRSLRLIQSYQSGETLAQVDQQDCLDVLNDMLDLWSIDKQYVFGSNENLLTWVPTKNQYTIGNPTNTSLGEPNFTGTLTSGSPTISSVTNIPADLKAGATLTDVANCIPAGTTVLSIGASSITMSANASATPSNNPDSIGYTIPGDFAIPRPVRITSGYTRFNQLDFPLDVYASQEEYNSILYKAQPGPWPTVAWYNNQFPYGILNVYQTPGNSATLHLFTDTILGNLTINQTFIMPQGYAMALALNLAVYLWPEYQSPATIPPLLLKQAKDALDMIKALNAQPIPKSTYDSILLKGNRADYGFILSGGYK